MGTQSTTKFIKDILGQQTEEAALTTSAGSIDAQKLVALGAGGFLDPSILNAKVVSSGATDASKVVLLDPSGKIDLTVLPVGVGADVGSIIASEALAAGDFVNVWNSGGAKVRKADATVAGKEAHGFVLSSCASGSSASVYFEGTNTAVTGQTAGKVFLSTTAGLAASAAPASSGNLVQVIGFATSASSINFQSGPTLVKA
ncbi:hypothetical protein DTO96_102382 [Ephemeroptericola cinctiostellae]|uniref:Uncharacterized protein n=1 Tax=Ephemeroptericola cinctiostellae TaxID=2268024 RepID=A0A345DE39_9BURK|nr:hypothetical protein [Ephemeroptericola cinctiostellae]AXF86627.1 hypothetical protein DTO96_102382 [Ephemeroptericola cinctiostellae]